MATITAPVGVKLSGTGEFKQGLIRDNVLRRMNSEAANGLEVGVDLISAVSSGVIVDNNVMEVVSSSVAGSVNNGFRHQTAAKVKVFNNLEMNGTLIRGYNTTTTFHDSELTTEVEDVIFGI